jgi:hypothetical protein
LNQISQGCPHFRVATSFPAPGAQSALASGQHTRGQTVLPLFVPTSVMVRNERLSPGLISRGAVCGAWRPSSREASGYHQPESIT